MKVLHVIGSVGHLRGGPSFVISNLTRALASRGVEVHVATTDDNGPEQRLRVPTGIPLCKDGVFYWHFRRQTGFYACSMPLAKWLWLHVSDYDLVHIHALFNFSCTAAAWAAAARGVPYVVRPLGVLNRWGFRNRRPLLKQVSFRFVEGPILRRAATVHYTSEQECSEAHRVAALSQAAIVANPANPPIHVEPLKGQFRARYPEFADRKLILFLSRLDPKKGLDLLITAFARARETNTSLALVVAGSGEKTFVQGLEQQAARLGIAQHVLWTGFLSGDLKAAALADSDLFVLPSYSENFGLAVLEAMAFRVPVIVSDQVAIHREIARADAGVVVPCEEQALATAMSSLLASQETVLRIVNNACKLLVEEFSSRVVLDKLLAVYQGVIGKDKGKREANRQPEDLLNANSRTH